ncbi:tripartite-type tricarboxylate transporter receptor subunit TctC [Leucobacter exalbidus]|uniref:Tripartite-type tricarboxylate transporter receptor subunit TctC n=1 Tax=Leucobacter exalbidus TaxID=662960 RepID=A0A940PT08_9MICO|nr:tripartite tricarboxylate transporter substrate binding protein [Leucobacter exalbidus]MBP1326277.1 tripartite-type tricarboxylate transporter receptor subunit TctC [Leucobacter exalbidus]
MNTQLRRGVALIALTGLALGATACANRGGGESSAAEFPSKTITLYTPTTAGGATDLAARTIGAEMETELGVSVVVDNRPGGAGSVGMEHVAGTKADGYSIAVLPVEVSMLGEQGYNIDHENYDFLGRLNSQPGTLAVPADSKFKTLDDLVAAAKEAPGSVTISNAGAGSIWEIGATAVGDAAGVKFQSVPFDGGAPAVTAAMGGQVDAVFAGIGETAPAHDQGQLRVLAVFTEEEAPALEGVPTAISQGYDVVIGSWATVAAPAGLDDAVRDTLEAAVATAAESDKFVTFTTDSGNIPLYQDAESTTAFAASENKRFAEILAK